MTPRSTSRTTSSLGSGAVTEAGGTLNVAGANTFTNAGQAVINGFNGGTGWVTNAISGSTNTASFSVNHGVGWHGLILAPKATVTSSQHPQLSGQIIAKTMPTSDWVLNHVTFAGCVPAPNGKPTISSP